MKPKFKFILLGLFSLLLGAAFGFKAKESFSVVMSPVKGSYYYHTPGNVAVQGNLSVGTTVPDTAAIVEFKSTTKAVKIPCMTTTQRNAISGPSEGLMVYNTTTHAFNFHNGSGWTTMQGATGPTGPTGP